jgi:DNA-binding Lrp family transcriptional regulator
MESAPIPDGTPRVVERDAWLLDALQRDFPMETRPWDALAQRRAGLSGGQVLGRVRALREDGIIRQISPIYSSTHALGYCSALVAARVREARLDAAADVVSAHPGVSHNYRREAEYNLWFTLATPPGRDFEAELARLADRAGLERYRPLPTLRTFHMECGWRWRWGGRAYAAAAEFERGVGRAGRGAGGAERL